jgi:hypothetical protein
MAPSFARSHLAISNHFQNLILTVCLFWSLQERFLGTLQSTPASTCSCKTSTVLSLLKPVDENICGEMAIFSRGRNLGIILRPSWLSSISSYLWRRDCTAVVQWLNSNSTLDSSFWHLSIESTKGINSKDESDAFTCHYELYMVLHGCQILPTHKCGAPNILAWTLHDTLT